ncbi:Adenosylcobinamide-GDP ribazoletransferase [Austwickia sp. TVS 96-490-7B]|uniref:adenosylcobinamide-GDP ribazoletransferase n=1 Tax=Austwickia sp. TVS 96-490-7B TaxID=2830843 RepID=UPI001C56409D|nr:adenosylcobinamide-GDP ribazoletransferase [Austwickia sp. TVS 96-490-7B]MBW3084761.1 Adenosylcobinamide-GDP ribazoletransferase [Austwickia sp. TVS 96-490-7B]
MTDQPSKSRPGAGPGVLPRDGFALAAGTLTILPTPAPTAVNTRVAGLAMIVGPLVMAPVALVACLIGHLVAAAGAPPLAAGLVTIGMLLIGTRAIHADGLADTVDGLGASWDRERALDVMRRGDVGPMGAVALVVVTMLQAVCMGAILENPHGWVWAAVLVAASRSALATGTRRGVPAARPEGLGEAVAGAVSWLRWGVTWLVTAAVVVASGWAVGQSPVIAGVAVLSAAVAVEVFLAFVVRRLGGITGDVLGALVETAATVSLLVATC